MSIKETSLREYLKSIPHQCGLSSEEISVRLYDLLCKGFRACRDYPDDDLLMSDVAEITSSASLKAFACTSEDWNAFLVICKDELHNLLQEYRLRTNVESLLANIEPTANNHQQLQMLCKRESIETKLWERHPIQILSGWISSSAHYEKLSYTPNIDRIRARFKDIVIETIQYDLKEQEVKSSSDDIARSLEQKQLAIRAAHPGNVAPDPNLEAGNLFIDGETRLRASIAEQKADELYADAEFIPALSHYQRAINERSILIYPQLCLTEIAHNYLRAALCSHALHNRHATLDYLSHANHHYNELSLEDKLETLCLLITYSDEREEDCRLHVMNYLEQIGQHYNEINIQERLVKLYSTIRKKDKPQLMSMYLQNMVTMLETVHADDVDAFAQAATKCVRRVFHYCIHRYSATLVPSLFPTLRTLIRRHHAVINADDKVYFYRLFAKFDDNEMTTRAYYHACIMLIYQNENINSALVLSVYHELAKCYVKLKHTNEAIFYYKKVLSLSNYTRFILEKSQALLALSELYLNQRKHHAALSMLEQGLDLEQNNLSQYTAAELVYCHYQSARILKTIAPEQNDRILYHLRTALQIADVTDVALREKIYTDLGHSPFTEPFMASSEYRMQIVALLRQINRCDENTTTQRLLAIIRQADHLGCPVEAAYFCIKIHMRARSQEIDDSVLIECYQTIIRVSENKRQKFMALSELANISYKRGKYSLAIIQAKLALKCHHVVHVSVCYQTLKLIIKNHWLLKEFAKVIIYCDKIIKANISKTNRLVMAHTYKGLAYHGLGDAEQAERHFKYALSLTEENDFSEVFRLYFLCGKAPSSSKMTDDAFKATLSRLIKLDKIQITDLSPHATYALYDEMGTLCVRAGLIAQARWYYHYQAGQIAAHETDAKVKNLLTRYSIEDNASEQESFLCEAREVIKPGSPHQFELGYTCGIHHLRKNDFTKACEFFSALVATDATSKGETDHQFKAYYQLVALHYKLRNTQQAQLHAIAFIRFSQNSAHSNPQIECQIRWFLLRCNHNMEYKVKLARELMSERYCEHLSVEERRYVHGILEKRAASPVVVAASHFAKVNEPADAESNPQAQPAPAMKACFKHAVN